MSHTGMANHFSWHIQFKKLLAACLISALAFGSVPASVLGGPQAPDQFITVTTAADKYFPALPPCVALTPPMIAGGLPGGISLREAICAANNAWMVPMPPETIRFAIPGPGPQVITVGNDITIPPTMPPGTPLPSLLWSMTIDGRTQAAGPGRPLIFLDGSPTRPAGAFNGLTISAPGVNIYVLGIMNFGANGIEINGVPNAVIQGNYIGIDPPGINATPNGMSGVLVSSAAGNTIGGPAMGQWNVISGNQGDGVKIWGATAAGNKVQGNLIGTDFAGLSAVANGGAGVHVLDAPGNIIGGGNPGEGNQISGNMGEGVLIEGSQANVNIVQGNFIGTDAGGLSQVANGGSGVHVDDGSGNTIGGVNPGEGNVISGNSGQGVFIEGISPSYNANYNQVQGNKIGTDVNGALDLGNSLSGVYITDAMTNTIGGTVSGSRNLISGNDQNGITISGSLAYGNLVYSNTIGTDITGTTAISNTFSGVNIDGAPMNKIGAASMGNLISGNGLHGVQIAGSGAHDNLVLGNKIGSDILGSGAIPNQYSGIFITDAPTTTIGGAATGEGNLISGNDGSGVYIGGTGAHDNLVMGNKIGTDLSGRAKLENGEEGVYLNNAPTNTIGGVTAGMGNLISGNGEFGIHINQSGAYGNLLYGNIIGMNAVMTGTLPNSDSGVFIRQASDNNIGGTNAGESNTIAGNATEGVVVVGTSPIPVQNLISGNSIYNNGSLGIDLKEDGVTANDNLDADSGPNNLQNYPLIWLVVVPDVSLRMIAHTYVKGELNSLASTNFTIEFYSSPTCDSSGYGEGKYYLTTQSVTTTVSGKADFYFDLGVATDVGDYLSALAIDPQGNTSEFSACRRIVKSLLFLPVIQK